MSTPHTGIELDEHFDMVIDETGDVGAVSDIEELQKDLSASISSIIDSAAIGLPLTPNSAAELQSVLETRVAFDQRITDIQQVSIGRDQQTDSIVVEIVAESIYGDFSFNTS